MEEKCQNNEWKCFLKRQKITAHKHKEAFSTLVEYLYNWHTFISRIFLKIG